jgi:hypothetical protein
MIGKIGSTQGERTVRTPASNAKPKGSVVMP